MTSRRRFLAAVSLVVAVAASPAVAVAAADTPEAFAAAVYAPVVAGDGTAGGSAITDRKARARWFTRSLVTIWNAAEDKADKDGEIGPLDFDLLTDGQDPQVGRIAVASREAKPESAVVRVSLFAAKKAKPGEKPYSALDLALVREAGAWRIDDVKQVSSKDPWTLRGLLSLQ